MTTRKEEILTTFKKEWRHALEVSNKWCRENMPLYNMKDKDSFCRYLDAHDLNFKKLSTALTLAREKAEKALLEIGEEFKPNDAG